MTESIVGVAIGLAFAVLIVAVQVVAQMAGHTRRRRERIAAAQQIVERGRLLREQLQREEAAHAQRLQRLREELRL